MRSIDDFEVVHKQYLIYIIFSLFLSCTSHNSDLKEAELLMSDYPDSALSILRKINPAAMTPDRDKAFYGLLLAEALEVNFEPNAPDSVIQFSVDYYRRRGDQLNLAKALYYQANTYRSVNDYQSATDNYLQALQLCSEENDSNLLGSIHKAMGQVSYYLKDYEKARQEFLTSIRYYNAVGDCSKVADCYNEIGKIYHITGKYDEAIAIVRKALAENRDPYITNRSLGLIANSYYELREYDSARLYIKETFKYPFLSENNKAFVMTILANVYFAKGELDSAEYYAKDALLHSPNIYNQRVSYAVLTNVQVNSQNKNRQAEYFRLYQKYNDSIIKIESQAKVNDLEKIHKNKVVAQSVKGRYSIIFLILILALIGLIVFAIYRLRLNRKNRQELLHNNILDRLEYFDKQRQSLHTKIINAKSLRLKSGKNSILIKRDEIVKSIYQELLFVDEPEIFLRESELYIGRFSTMLKNSFPHLSEKELMWCCFQLLGIEQADILTLLDYKISSFSKFKQRLAKKMQLNDAFELNTFLQSFFENNCVK